MDDIQLVHPVRFQQLTGSTITEIGTICGLSNPSNARRWFARAKGSKRNPTTQVMRLLGYELRLRELKGQHGAQRV